jgi:hypothetical protein
MPDFPLIGSAGDGGSRKLDLHRIVEKKERGEGFIYLSAFSRDP